MTRIIAGSAGGRRIATPPGDGTRPTSDRVREAMFSRLEHLGVVEDVRVLDLYAGSGALGLEALSRGAASAVFVDAAAKAVATIRSNAADLGWRDRVTVVRGSAVSWLEALAAAPPPAPATPRQALPSAPYDLVLIDPPYAVTETEITAVLTALRPLLSRDAVVVVERSTRSPRPSWPDGLTEFDAKTYGETALWYAEPAPDDA